MEIQHWNPLSTSHSKERIMARITLRFQQQEIAQYELTSRGVRIGRSQENDIVIDNMAVSGKHARIIDDEMGFIIKDLGSWNGTFIDGKPIESRRLSDGDVITIGKHVLVFSDGGQSSRDKQDLNKQDGVLPTSPSGPEYSTVFLNTQEQKAMLDQYDRLGNKIPLLVVKFKERILYKYLLKNKATTIGRDPGNRVVIDNLAVSSRHAAITADGNGFTISDLDSRNGTFVNKKPIKTCRLYNGDVITIGRHELLFEQAGTYTYDETAQPFVADSPLDASAETAYLNTTAYKELLAGRHPHGSGSVPGFAFLKGGQGYLPIEKKRFEIGKNKTCDLVVKGLTIGDKAAIATREHDGYYLSYKSGLSKPLVNGRKINKSVKLESGDVIQIGPVKLKFHA